MTTALVLLGAGIVVLAVALASVLRIAGTAGPSTRQARQCPARRRRAPVGPVPRRRHVAGRASGRAHASMRGTDVSVAEARLERALDAIPQGVVISDEAGEIAFRNTGGRRYLSARHGDALVEEAIGELSQESIAGTGSEPHHRPVRAASAHARAQAVPLDIERRTRGRARRDRGRVRAPPARGRAPRLRRQHQPRAQDAGRGAGAAGRDAPGEDDPPCPGGSPSGC